MLEDGEFEREIPVSQQTTAMRSAGRGGFCVSVMIMVVIALGRVIMFGVHQEVGQTATEGEEDEQGEEKFFVHGKI